MHRQHGEAMTRRHLTAHGSPVPFPLRWRVWTIAAAQCGLRGFLAKGVVVDVAKHFLEAAHAGGSADAHAQSRAAQEALAALNCSGRLGSSRRTHVFFCDVELLCKGLPVASLHQVGSQQAHVDAAQVRLGQIRFKDVGLHDERVAELSKHVEAIGESRIRDGERLEELLIRGQVSVVATVSEWRNGIEIKSSLGQHETARGANRELLVVLKQQAVAPRLVVGADSLAQKRSPVESDADLDVHGFQIGSAETLHCCDSNPF